jgi:restriction-modification enzyme MmeI-like protein
VTTSTPIPGPISGPNAVAPDPTPERIEAFIAYWQGREGGQERANYQIFLARLCRLLNLPEPDAADATHEHNNYVFERAVTRHRDDGDARGRIDLYRRGSFVLEAKQSRMRGGKKEIVGQSDLFAIDKIEVRGQPNASRAWDVLMLNAKRQAEDYARALPTSHGWPPFVLVCDVGNCIEVYADFSGQGKNYSQFPDRRNFRIYLEHLRKSEVRLRLQRVWLDPQSLNPAHIRAKVTRDIAERLSFAASQECREDLCEAPDSRMARGGIYYWKSAVHRSEIPARAAG